MDKVPAAIIGASGMVGQRFVAMLQNHPSIELVEIYSSDRSKGKKLSEIWKLPETVLSDDFASMKLEKLDISDIARKGAKVAFSAIPADLAKSIEQKMASEGLAVFSNTSAYRMDDLTPILIPEINHEHLGIVEIQRKERKSQGFIVTNANCSVTGLAIALKPLVDRFDIPSVFVSTYQAISGAGYPGVPSLDINANCLPFINREEEKMNREAKKILGKFEGRSISMKDIDIHANCVRVPARDGHLEAVTIPLSEETTAEEVADTFSGFKGVPQKLGLPTAPERAIILREEDNRPQPILDAMAGWPERTRGMAVSVGRIRIEKGILRFFCLVHNTIRGSAGGSILNAEYAMHEGIL